MSEQDGRSSILEDNVVVDADVHVSKDVEVMASYLDEPYESRMLNEYCWPASVGSQWDPTMSGAIPRRYVDSPEDVREVLCEEYGIDYPLLNPMMGTVTLPNTDLAMAFMRARNDEFIERFLDPSDFRGLGLLSTQDPVQAAEEVDRLADEKGIVGLFLQTTGPDPPLGDPSYDVIYDAAQSNDLPIAFHAATSQHTFKTAFPIQNQGLEEYLSVHTLGHLWSQTLTFTSLLVQGTPAKFPDLNFVFLETGLSWVPYMMWRLNKEYSFRADEAPLLERQPESYVRDQFYFASQPLGEPERPGDLAPIIDVLGPESIMFASDYPHWDFDHPSGLEGHLRATFDGDEREQVLTRTAAEAFGLDV